MFLFKIIALSLTGTAGVLGSASPLIHIGVTKSNGKIRGRMRTEDFSEPILKNCKPKDSPANKGEVNFHNKLYSVFMKLEEGAAINTGTYKISLRVEETDTSTKITKEVKISDGKEGGSGREGGLGYKDGRNGQKASLDFKFGYQDKWSDYERLGDTNCESKKLEPSTNRTFGSGAPVKSSEIKLNLVPDKTCRKYFSSVECDVTINVSDKLKGIDGQQPKIIYTAF